MIILKIKEIDDLNVQRLRQWIPTQGTSEALTCQ